MDGQQQFADAMRAFDAYYGTRRTAYGVDWPKRRYAEHRSWKAFLKVAAYCSSIKADVERYVTTVVEHSKKNGLDITPNDLMTKKAEEVWSVHKDDRKANAATKWAFLVSQVTQIQRTTGQADEVILSSAFHPQFPAWFRVFYPETIDDRVLSLYGEEALADFHNDRDLVRFLRAAMAAKVESFEKKMGVIDGL